MKKFENLINKKIKPILVDMYVESEILGCEVIKKSDKLITKGPLQEEAYIPCKCRIPNEDSVKMPEILKDIENNKNNLKENEAICIALSGPLTLSLNLRGEKFLKDLTDDENYAKELLEFCAEVVIKMSDMYIKAGADIIIVSDKNVCKIEKDIFDSLFSESYTAIFDCIKRNNICSCMFNGTGDNLQSIINTEPDYILIKEKINPINENTNVQILDEISEWW